MQIKKVPVPAKSNAGRKKKYDFALLGGETCLEIPIEGKTSREVETLRTSVYGSAADQQCKAITKIERNAEGARVLRVWKQ